MAEGKQLDEVQVADAQQQFREQMADFVSLSFDTISSIGANGAIIHYKVGCDPTLLVDALGTP